MKYKSAEEIADPIKALGHFIRDMTYEIKQLKYYTVRAKSLSGLSTAFGIHEELIKDAEDKLKKARYLKDTFMEWNAERKLKKYAPTTYEQLVKNHSNSFKPESF